MLLTSRVAPAGSKVGVGAAEQVRGRSPGGRRRLVIPAAGRDWLARIGRPGPLVARVRSQEALRWAAGNAVEHLGRVRRQAEAGLSSSTVRSTRLQRRSAATANR